MFHGFDLYYTDPGSVFCRSCTTYADPAQPLTTAGVELDHLQSVDHGLSEMCTSVREDLHQKEKTSVASLPRLSCFSL